MHNGNFNVTIRRGPDLALGSQWILHGGDSSPIILRELSHNFKSKIPSVISPFKITEDQIWASVSQPCKIDKIHGRDANAQMWALLLQVQTRRWSMLVWSGSVLVCGRPSTTTLNKFCTRATPSPFLRTLTITYPQDPQWGRSESTEFRELTFDKGNNAEMTPFPGQSPTLSHNNIARLGYLPPGVQFRHNVRQFATFFASSRSTHGIPWVQDLCNIGQTLDVGFAIL